MMNTKILQKVLDELKKPTPSLDYVRGMVETLIEMDDKKEIITGAFMPSFNETPNFYSKSSSTVPAELLKTDEEKAYEQKMAGGPIGHIG